MRNANMPKGRGMVKWTPFAAMPEQFAGICDMNHKFAASASLCFQDLKNIFNVAFK